MASNISVSVDVEVQSGPKVSYSLVESVEAYGLTEVVIPKSTLPATPKEVPIVPAGPGEVRLLAITSDRYHQGLKYIPKDTAAGTKEVVLNAPQLLLGGAIGLLEKVPQTLLFSNNSATDDAKVQILVGRKI